MMIKSIISEHYGNVYRAIWTTVADLKLILNRKVERDGTTIPASGNFSLFSSTKPLSYTSNYIYQSNQDTIRTNW